MDDSKRTPAGATIQIDISDVQLVDPDAAARGPGSGKTPPPLPASGLAQPPPAPASQARTGPTRRQLAVLVAGVVVAIAAGLAVGLHARRAPAAAASAVSLPSTPPVAVPARLPAPSASVLTIPPIEVK